MPKSDGRLIVREFLLPVVIFSLTIFFQNYNLGKLVNVFTDEGVYLYAAKLIGKGFIPYRDFFHGHTPYLILPVALFFKLLGPNMNLFHFCYTLWFYSSLFPIFFLVKKLTESDYAALLSLVLYSTYQELVQWGTHQFDMRQASLPFLAWGLYFLLCRFRPKLAAVILALFAIGLVSNVPLAILLIGLVLAGEIVWVSHSPRETLKKYGLFLAIFLLISFFAYSALFLIPRAYENFIGYQLGRPFLAYETRFEWMMDNIRYNWPIFFFGLMGSLLFSRPHKFFGLFNIAGLFLVVFLGSNFYPHYLTILSVGLAVAGGVALEKLRYLGLGAASLIFLFAGLYSTSYENLKYQLVDKQTPEFFRAVKILQKYPGPLFAFEPIYALYAGRDLTFHYHAADMRYFRVMGTNLDDREYQRILFASNEVLIEPFARSMMTPASLEILERHFRLVFEDGDQQIYIRNQPAF